MTIKQNILFIGAHTDDIEHGVGGTFSKFLRNSNYKVIYLTFSRCLDLERNKGIELEQSEILNYVKENNGIPEILNFPNRNLYKHSGEIRSILEKYREEFNPTLIFSHWRGDIHQDHQTISSECQRVYKEGNLLEYPCIPSSPNFQSNLFIKLEEEDILNKIKMLSIYKTQSSLYYNQEDLIKSLARVNGSKIKSDFAEEFYSNKLVLNL